MNIDELLAREAIRYTMSVYQSEGDRGRVAGLASAFTDDGVLAPDDGSRRRLHRRTVECAQSSTRKNAA